MPSAGVTEAEAHATGRTPRPAGARCLLVYRFHALGSEKLDMDSAKEAVRRAFQTWSNITCRGKRTSLRFEESSEIPGKSPLATNSPAKTAFGIYFRDDVWPYDKGDESLALTNQTFGTTNGYLDYSDIEVNTTTRTFALEDDERHRGRGVRGSERRRLRGERSACERRRGWRDGVRGLRRAPRPRACGARVRRARAVTSPGVSAGVIRFAHGRRSHQHPPGGQHE